MRTIYKVIEISASHQILSEGYEGKCKDLHGHNYKVEVWINNKGMTNYHLDKHGMMIDFNEIKKIVNFLDHKHLNDIEGLEITPTAEHIAEYISKHLPNWNKVRVWETSSSYAEYEC